jgi:YfiH family protein
MDISGSLSLVEAAGVWRSPLLNQFAWLDHGFGGRHAGAWPPEPAAALAQVHGATVLTATTPGAQGEGDALLTAHSGIYLTVRTADCLPLLMADARQRKVAAVHAGWRGTVARVAARTVETLGGDPADVWVAVGPGIGACCFEVGPEVAREFGATGRCMIDLFAHNLQQLLEIGVPAAQIAGQAPCTMCTPAHFHSFRRDKQDAGRMHAAIALR